MLSSNGVRIQGSFRWVEGLELEVTILKGFYRPELGVSVEDIQGSKALGILYVAFWSWCLKWKVTGVA